MSIWSRFLGRSSTTKATSDLDLESPEIEHLLNYFNLEFTKSSNGRIELSPRGGDLTPVDAEGFSSLWFDSAYINDDAMNDDIRARRYEYYDFMDANSTEAGITLDTYADEAVFTGFLEDSPLNIKISNKSVEAEIMKILSKSGILPDNNPTVAVRSDIRSLAKYGDHYLKLSGRRDNLHVTRLRTPAPISIRFDPMTSQSLGYIVSKRIEYNPWEFTHFSVSDSNCLPYGRSRLESMRAAYQQLLLNEALLALTRSSRVEKIIVRVPAPGNNPTSAFATLSKVRSSWKNVIFGSTGSAKSNSRITGLQDILWMPSGKEYGIDRLQSSIDISSIDDVEYFRDKYLMGSRLPKSYLLADDTQRLTEGALAAQDLKFARALVPLQVGYVEGMTTLITQLIILLGHDPTKVTATVTMNKPQIINTYLITQASETIRMVSDLLDSFYRGTETEKRITPEGWLKLTTTITSLPPELLKIITTKSRDPNAELAEELLAKTKEYTDNMTNTKIVGTSQSAVRNIIGNAADVHRQLYQINERTKSSPVGVGTPVRTKSRL